MRIRYAAAALVLLLPLAGCGNVADTPAGRTAVRVCADHMADYAYSSGLWDTPSRMSTDGVKVKKTAPGVYSVEFKTVIEMGCDAQVDDSGRWNGKYEMLIDGEVVDSQ